MKDKISIKDFNHVHLNGYEIYEVNQITDGVQSFPWCIVHGDDYIRDEPTLLDALKFCTNYDAL